MKKILAILLLIMMALPLAACGSDDTAASSNIDVNSSDTDVDSSETDVEPGDADVDSSETDVEPGDADVDSSETDVEPGDADVDSSETDVGPGEIDVEPDNTEQEETKEKVKSDGYDKFSQLEIGMTEDEVNAILGEPTKIDKAYYYYNITVNGNDLELQVWINTVSGLVTYIQGDFSKEEYRAEFADSATDLSTVNGLKSGKINTYDACVSAFKTPGYLINISEDGVKEYLWVNSNDGYMTVTFKADGSVKTYNGYC